MACWGPMGLEPDAGRVTVLGGAARDHRDQIGYLPEERGLYRKMTAVETIAYFGRLKGLRARDARAEAKRLLEFYGLGDAMNRNVEALSKGMAQKVQLLATIVHKPRLLILDEPFSGLDPVNQEILEELIRAQVRDGVTVLTARWPKRVTNCPAACI
jgi:ABC-2 type transport system ATP-binding protein